MQFLGMYPEDTCMHKDLSLNIIITTMYNKNGKTTSYLTIIKEVNYGPFTDDGILFKFMLAVLTINSKSQSGLTEWLAFCFLT